MGIRAYYQPDSAVSVRNACGGLRFSLPAPGAQCLYAPRLPTHARDAFSHESAFRLPAGLCADLLRNRHLHAHTVAPFLVRTFSSAPARLPCGAAAIHILLRPRRPLYAALRQNGHIRPALWAFERSFRASRSAGGRYFQAHAARCCRLLRRFGSHLVSLPRGQAISFEPSASNVVLPACALRGRLLLACAFVAALSPSAA